MSKTKTISKQVVEKGIYQVMSDGTKTCVPFGITKREREREMKRELANCFKQIAAETGKPAREPRERTALEILADIFEANGWNDVQDVA